MKKEKQEKASVEESRKTEVKEIKIDIDAWNPKTEIGKKVKRGDITDIDEILNEGHKILESEIIDILIPNIQHDLLLIGQSKGKFGGGQRRVFKQTQKKTKEGNKPSFMACAVVGNEDGYVGIGYGKSKETVPAREKAIRNAKLNLFKIRRGSGSWESTNTEAHSIPYQVEGKCGSVRLVLMPAPKGKGLIIEKECAKILKLAGVNDVWSRSFGQTKVKTNLINACVEALKHTIKTKIKLDHIEKIGIIEGKK